MTDEERARDLLTLAAELPDSVQPPIRRLIEQGRARRARRTTLSGITATTMVAAVIASVFIAGLGAKPARNPAVSGHVPSGPTAGQISRFRWSARPPSPLGPRSQPLLVWTGKELIELGGIRKGSTQNDGAAFDVATGRWRRIPQAIGNVGFGVTVWTGHQLFATNNPIESCDIGLAAPCPPHAGLYDPVTNRWTFTLLPRQTEGLTPTAAVWTGRDVILGFVGAAGNSGKLGVAAYNPAANRWQVITPALPPGHPCRFISMVATSNRLILWSFWDRVHRNFDYSGVDVLALGRDGTWRDVTGRWPQHVTVAAPVFTGRAILLSPSQEGWCGTLCQGGFLLRSPAYFVDPATLARTALPLGPLGETNPVFAWTGRTIIATNLYAPGGPLRLDDMALYDPATGQWRRLPAPPGHPALAAPPVWSGNQLLELTSSGDVLSFHR